MVDATARLYDVDEDTLVFTRLQEKRSYDQGTIEFRARKGQLIDLDKLHESIWATRLSGRTSSGLISLVVTAVGKVVKTEKGIVLKVANSKEEFILEKHTDKKYSTLFQNLGEHSSNRMVSITGLIDNYRGRWPTVLNKKPIGPRRILVTSFTPLR